MYRWIDHTAEVEIAIEASSEREVFEDALAALRELLGFGPLAGGSERRTLAARGPDRPALLAAWLEELVYLAESEGFVATRVERLSLPPQIIDNLVDKNFGDNLADNFVGNFVDNPLTAVVAGVIADPPPLVKAVTYHRLAFAPAGEGYVANVVLDV